MKILAVSYDYRPKLGGIATLAYHVLKSLSQMDEVQVRVVSSQEEGDRVFDLQSGLETKRVSLSSSWYKSIAPLSLRLSKEIAEYQPDVILDFLWAPEGIATFISTRLRERIPYFIFAHGVELLESNVTAKKKIRSLLAPLKKQVFKNASMIFSNSHFTQELVTNWCGVEKQKIQVIRPGVDVEEFYPLSQNLPQDLLQKYQLQNKKVFLTVSRLVDYKGIDRCLMALKNVIAQHANVTYLICGEGEDRRRLESIARDCGVQKNVVFTGPVPPERLRDHYHLCDTFVLVSRNDWITPNVEGFGLVVLEAAACGRPSIVGKSGGMEDTLVPQQTGWVVDPESIDEITEAMLDSLDHPDKNQAFGRHARDRVVTECSWKKMAESIFNTLRKQMKHHVRN